LGTGEVGGKAQGLILIDNLIRGRLDATAYPQLRVDVPWFWVIATDWFDRFMKNNGLYDVALADTKDHHLANAFQRADLPGALVDELSRLLETISGPLAVRSSSLLEDALQEPYAGVYCTKMIPNNQFSADARLRTLVEAVKFVYASTFFRDAKSYRDAMGRPHKDEKMAVIIQEVVGARRGDRFYPEISGVARSYNFYSLGYSRPEEGVVSLALGLGKTIVDGGRSWTYCPVHPRAQPPYGSMKELLVQTQTDYWAINMGKPPRYDPICDAEFLLQGDLGTAEAEGSLQGIASTYDQRSDRLSPGTGTKGARVLNFAPILELDDVPLNKLVRDFMTICEEELSNPVEMEFAVNLGGRGDGKARCSFLQLRQICVSNDRVDIDDSELCADNVLVASEEVLGNGCLDVIRDVVYVDPSTFSSRDTWLIAAELDEMNRYLVIEERPYLLVVLGRLGSSDPWLGIPVRWAQVSGAKAVVEASSLGMNVDMSQGSHFFHNVTCLQVLYFSTDKTGRYPVDWEWLARQNMVRESRFARHVALDRPLHVKVDGRSRRGVIRYERADSVRD
jgi:hypothetical protein